MAAAPPPGTAEVDLVLARLHDPAVGRDLKSAERGFILILGSRSTRGAPDAAIADLKRLMVNAVFQHDRKTHFCNSLAETWALEPNALGRALAVCPYTLDTSQDVCAVFFQRLTALREMMRNFGSLYSDPRLGLKERDVAYWRNLLNCSSDQPGRKPPSELRYISDLLVTFSSRLIRGLKPLDPATDSQISQFDDVSMARYRQVLENACAHYANEDPNLLRTMECRAAGLRERHGLRG